MIKKNWLSILLLTAVSISAQIKVIENNNSKFTFSWELDNFDTISVEKNEKKVISLSFSGENMLIGEVGQPAIPGFSMLLGTPPEGHADVSFSPQEIKTLKLTSPLMRVFSSLDETRQPDLNFSSVWISDPMYSKTGNIKTVQFVIKPFVYDSALNIIKVLTKATCTINFPRYISNPVSSSFRSDFDRMMNNLLWNYQIARGWSERKLQKKAAKSFPLEPDEAYLFKIGDGHTGINEATTNENGIVKITGSKILDLFGRISINQVALFGSLKGELSVEIPTENKIPDGVIEIPLMRVDKNSNGMVDNEDFFLAYVTGASDWVYEDSINDFVFRLDRYDDYRHYWLCRKSVNGSSMKKYNQIDEPGDTLRNFVNRIKFKRSVQEPYKNDGGLDWIWAKLTPPNPSFEYGIQLPGLDKNYGGTIRLNKRGINGGGADILIGKQIFEDCNNDTEYEVDRWDDKRLRINLVAPYDTSNTELVSFQVKYKRKLEATGSDKFNVFSPLDSGIYHYSIKKTSNELLYIFRIPSDEQQISFIDTIRGQGLYTWCDTGIVQFFICSENMIIDLPQQINMQPSNENSFVVKNLRAANNTTDFLIIAHPEFVNEAIELAKHKKSRFSHPKIVSVHDIYRFFSGNDIDPTAIRNFLVFVRNFWNADNLLYVVLFGGGHYDYKNVRYSAPNYIPTFYYIDKAVDDYFAYTDPDSSAYGKVQLALGRFPCTNRQHAAALVKKVIEIENPLQADFSEWRNRALFVADDDMQGDKKDPIVGTSGHHTSSDKTSDVIKELNPSIDMRKIYLYEYEWNSAYEKPAVSKAILNEINNGVAYVNFFGHGSEVQWTDERVLVPNHTGSMHNDKRYPVISSFSCSVGRFDLPDRECLSATLVNTPQRGAVSSVSSSRLAYATENETMAKTFYRHMFDTNYNSVGSALMNTKMEGVSTSRRLYVVLGDPSIRFVNPVRTVNLEIRNTKNKSIDTVMALQQISVTATVLDKKGKIDTKFGSSDKKAFIYLGLFNSPDSAMRKDGGSNENIRYQLPGTPVFLGKSQINNGKITQQLLIPKNLSFGKKGARVTAYVWKENENSVGLGCKQDLVFYGTENITSINDTSGPQIMVKNLVESGNITEQEDLSSAIRCEIELEDESGIDVTGTGPDEGLVIEVDGVIGKRNMNHTFQFFEGSFKKGSANIVFDENIFKPGLYKAAVSARDLLGNVSKSFFDLNISDDGLNFWLKPQVEIEQKYDYEIDRVFNVPNPMKMGKSTRFYFRPEKTEQKWMADYTKVVIRIYTLSGKIVRVIKDNAATGENGVFWNGRDQIGNILGPDVYLYQITAYSPRFQKTTKSKIKKLVIHPPR